MRLFWLLLTLCIAECLYCGCSSSNQPMQSSRSVQAQSVQAQIEKENRLSATAAIKGDKVASVQYARNALNLDKNNVSLKYHLGMELVAAGQNAEAKQVLEDVANMKGDTGADTEILARSARRVLTHLSKTR